MARTCGALYVFTSKCASLLTSQLPEVVRRCNVLCICTFSTSQLPRCGLYILPWKVSPRRKGVQFFMHPLARWLRTRYFSESTFRPSGATKHWKNTVFGDFRTFSCTCTFSLSNFLTFSLLSLYLNLLTFFPASSHLCFSSVRTLGSLTSKTSFSQSVDLCMRFPKCCLCLFVSVYIYAPPCIFVSTYICVASKFDVSMGCCFLPIFV